MKNGILSLFQNDKPIVGVIHSKGDSVDDAVTLAAKESDAYAENGIDGILVETYFGNYKSADAILAMIKKRHVNIPLGINCLNVDAMGFEMAIDHNCSFIQVDSVVGHVKPRDEESIAEFFKRYRARTDAYLMGGVRFKYQPVLSVNTVEKDLMVAMTRCDAICVTQDATGQETSIEKIKSFRNAIGNFPLFVCAGITPENVSEQLKYADGAVTGSYFKDTYKDTGTVCPEHVRKLMNVVEGIR